MDAGSIETLRRHILSSPAPSEVAYVVRRPLADDRQAELQRSLSRSISLPLVEVRTTTHLQPGRVYLAPPSAVLQPDRNRLLVPSEEIARRLESELGAPGDAGIHPSPGPVLAADPLQASYEVLCAMRDERESTDANRPGRPEELDLTDDDSARDDDPARRAQDATAGEARLCQVINNQLGLVGVIDRKGILREANDRFLKISGLTRDEVVGKHFAECAWWTYDRSVAAKVRESMTDAFAGRIVRYHVALYAANDERLMIDFMLAPVRDAKGEVAFLIPSGIDISDRIDVERAHRETAYRLNAILDTVVDGIITIDAQGCINSVNPAAAEVFGYDSAEMIGENVKLLMPDPYHSEHDGYLQAYRDTRQAKIIGTLQELTGRRKDGTVFPLELAVSETKLQGDHAFVGIVRDVTDRREHEFSSRQNEERLAMALRAGGMAAWEWNPHHIYWTDEMYQLLGISPETSMSLKTFFQAVHPEDLPGLQAGWQRTVEGHDTYLAEFRIVRPNGEVRWMKGLGESVYDEQGNVVRVIGLNWDSTQEHLAAEAVRESEQRAQAASISKSEFLANMSHEIRTPMTAVLGYTELLTRGEADPEKLDYLRTIKRNGNFLLEIINDILDLSKIEAGGLEIDRTSFAPHQLVGDVHALMSVRASEKKLALDVVYKGHIPAQVESDPKRLKQILVNLIGNAIKFTERGKVTLEVDFRPGEEPQLQFDVVDTGIGMTEQQQARLFQPFSQGDASVTRAFGGTGLGLAISQRLAEMLGGRISATSAFGEGSTFSCLISAGDVDMEQLVLPAAGSVVDTESTPSVLPDLDCRVLVVDDRRDVRFLARHFLTRSGAEVELAEDGLQALEIITGKLRGESPQIDLILLDMQMPRLDGYQTASRLRDIGCECPIVALTADAMQGDMNRCLASGCNDYLSKPINSATLIQLVADYTQGVERDEPTKRLADPRDGRDAPPHAQQRGPARILIVDDSVDACEMLRLLLDVEGFQAATAFDGPTAIEKSRTFRPNVVLLDLMLDGTSGFDVLSSLRELPELQQCRFFAVTGRDSQADVQRSQEAGFQHHLTKPVDIPELLALLRDEA